MGSKLADLLSRLDGMEKKSADSTLVIYEPSGEHAAFYRALCEGYLKSPEPDRVLVRDAVRDKPGILNQLLGYVYICTRLMGECRQEYWFNLGLAAASIRGDGPDFRDFYVALAELYAAALDAGLQPKEAFNTIGGGVPANFDSYAVLKSRLADSKQDH
jgi:hypothetical protein